MDATRFDALSRSLSLTPSRRAALNVLGGLLVGGALSRLGQPETEARKKHRKKPRKPLALNVFGCVDVGGKCRGNSANCCSGICAGKKPKKGKKDTSTCVAHDAATCVPGQQFTRCGGAVNVQCLTTAGLSGGCTTTTGNGAYCFNDVRCFACQRDTDCQAVCGAHAACIQCATACPDTGHTACASIGACTI